MSKTIDERVVEMRFDNQNFESNVKTSMSTLERLKQSLNFKNTASKNFDISPVGSAIDNVKSKFSALEVVGITALANITNSAVNAGKRIVSSLTIDPVKTGFSEYELKMGSVQTIMASTGESLATVNKYLDELNTYSDKTIYSFSDMTSNIGKFTNAGVKLEDAVLAMKGISNEAAISGANANEASRAMYNFSQALSAGYVKLIDWKSIENANMATVEFKTQLLESAVACGTLKDNLDGTYTTLSKGTLVSATQNFNDTLQEQWMTTEVLTNTLANYATDVREMSDAEVAAYEQKLKLKGYTDEQIKAIEELGKKAYDSAQDVKTFTMMMDTLKEAAQSGWAQTWEIIIGDFEEAKELWTEASEFFGDIIDNSAKSRNKVLEEALGSKFDKFTSYLQEAGISIDDFQSKLSDTLKESGISLDDLITKYGSLAGAISSGKISKSAIIETLKKFVTAEKEVSKVTSEVTGDLEKFQNIVNKVIKGDFDNGAKRIEKLTAAGYDYATVQQLINKVYERNGKTWKDTTITAEDLAGAIGDLSQEELKSIGYTEEQAQKLKELAAEAEKTGTPLNELIANLEKPSGRELVIDTIRNAIKSLQLVLMAAREAWDGFFEPMSGVPIYNFIAAIHALSKKLIFTDDSLKKLYRTFRGLFAVLDLIKIALGGAFNFTIKVLSNVFKNLNLNILDVTASIGDALVAFHDWVLEHSKFSKIVNGLADIISTVIVAINRWITEFLKLPKVTKFIEEFKKVATDALELVGEHIEKITDKVGDLNNISLDDIIKAFKTFGSTIRNSLFNDSGDFIGLDTLFDEIPEKIRNFTNKAVASPLKGSGSTLEQYKSKFLSTFGEIGKILDKNIGLGEVLTVVLGGSLALAMGKTSRVATTVLKALKGPLASFDILMTSITNTFKGVTKVLKGVAFSVRATAILKIAGAIAILAGSIFLLAQLDTKKLWSAVGAIGALAVILGLLSYAISKMDLGGFSLSRKGLKGSFSTILSLAAAIGILVLALKGLDDLNPENIIRNIGIITVLLAELVGASVLLAMYAKTLPAAALTIVGIAASIRIMVSALKSLDRIEFQHIEEDIVTLTAIIIGLTTLAAATSLLTDWKSGIAMLAIAASLKLMVSAFEGIAELDVSKIKDNIEAFILMFTSIAVLLTATAFAGPHAASAGIGILAMAGALIVLTLAMKMLSTMKSSDIKRATETISEIFMVFGLVVALSRFAGKYAIKAGTMILLMSGALLALTGVIVVLSHVDPSGLHRAVDAMSQLMIVFGIVVALSGFASKVSMGPLVAMAITLGVLTAALGAMAMIPAENIKKAVGALTAVLAMFAVVEAASQFVPEKSLKSLIGLSVAIGVICGMLMLLTSVANDAETVIAAAASISIVLLSLSASLFTLQYLSPLTSSRLKTLLGMTAILAAIAVILGVMAALKVEPSIETALSLSVLLLAMAGVCRIMSTGTLSPTAIQGAIVGAVALGAFVDILAVVVGAMLYLLGSLVDGGVADKIEHGAEVLSTIGYAIGDFVGSIVGGALAGMSSGLPAIGTNLSAFMTNLAPFFESIKGIDESSVENVKSLSKALLSLAGAQLLSAITSLISFGQGSLSTFGESLKPLGKGLKSFAQSVEGIEEYQSSIDAAVPVIESLANLNNTLPRIGGLLGFLAGNKESLATFGDDLKPLGKGLKAFGESVQGVEAYQASMDAAIPAAEALADVCNILPRIGGKIGEWFGDESLDTFGDSLKPLGKGLKAFGESVQGIEEYQASIDAAIPIAESLAKLNDIVPKMGGLISWLVGEENLKDFGDSLKPFAKGLMSFAKNVEGIEGYQGSIDSSIKAANSLAKLADKTSDLDLNDDFGPYAEKMGKSIKKFASTISEVNLDNASTLISKIKSFSTEMSKLSSVNYDGINKLKTAVSNLGKIASTNIATSFSKGASGVSTAVNSMVNKAVSAVKSGASKFTSAGKDLVSKLGSGMKSASSSITAAAKSLTTSAVSGIRNNYSKFNSAGKYLGDGLVSGLNSKKTAAYNAGYALGQASAKGVKDGGGVKSPSKLTMQTGRYLGDGLVIGINTKKKVVYNAGYDLGSTAVNSLSNSISSINALLSDDIDVQPTIRPVLDLSDIKSGVNAMDGMLNFDPSVDVRANTGAISYMMSKIQNGASNDDVVYAIDTLGRRISEMSGDTYNVNGITYDDGSNISVAVKSLVRAARIERRV